ncbi:MAG: RidA family protein [Xanthomonadales bacterium]|nr:RidA family protein [Xanthomonadales bacterium]
MDRRIIHTRQAPAAIGTYSQAVLHEGLLYLSGQIPLDPETMQLVDGDFSEQARRVFMNMAAVCSAAGTSLDRALKLTIYLTDMGNFPQVNEVMADFVAEPYPARAAVGVASLPKGAAVEADAIVAV